MKIQLIDTRTNQLREIYVATYEPTDITEIPDTEFLELFDSYEEFVEDSLSVE